jgi:hypothetical protein
MDDKRRITSFLAIGLGGILYHSAKLQGDSYNLHVSEHGSTVQVLGEADKRGGRFVYASFHVSERSTFALRREWFRLSQVSKNWTFAYPESEKFWQSQIAASCAHRGRNVNRNPARMGDGNGGLPE